MMYNRNYYQEEELIDSNSHMLVLVSLLLFWLASIPASFIWIAGTYIPYHCFMPVFGCWTVFLLAVAYIIHSLWQFAVVRCISCIVCFILFCVTTAFFGFFIIGSLFAAGSAAVGALSDKQNKP